MNLAISTIVLAGSLAIVWWMPAFRRIRLPVAIFLLSYGVTTVVGAGALLDSWGQAQLLAIHPNFGLATLESIGKIEYWSYLLAPLIVVPVAALVASAGTGRALRMRPALLSLLRAPNLAIALIITALVGYCFYKLAGANALTPGIFDSSLCFDDRMRRRAELIARLGNSFYSAAYSSVAILSVLWLAKAITERDRVAAAGFAVSCTALMWLYATLFMKYPYITFSIMVLLAVLLCGVGLLRGLLFFGPAAVAAFGLLTAAETCVPVYERPTPTEASVRPAPAASGQRDTGESKGDASAPLNAPAHAPESIPASAPTSAAPASAPAGFPIGHVSAPLQKLSQSSSVVALGENMARNVVFRMAVGFPYYLTVFDTESEYCGSGSRWLPFGPKPEVCEPAIKVFKAAYPDITSVVGYLPAPVHMAGLAQGGPPLAVLSLVLAGVAIGAAATIAAAMRGPVMVATTVSVCLFSHYLSQSSFRGALFHSYGLLWMLLPVFSVVLLGAVFKVRDRRNSPL